MLIKFRNAVPSAVYMRCEVQYAVVYTIRAGYKRVLVG